MSPSKHGWTWKPFLYTNTPLVVAREEHAMIGRRGARENTTSALLYELHRTERLSRTFGIKGRKKNHLGIVCEGGWRLVMVYKMVIKTPLINW